MTNNQSKQKAISPIYEVSLAALMILH